MKTWLFTFICNVQSQHDIKPPNYLPRVIAMEPILDKVLFYN